MLIGSLEASGGRRKILKKRENKSCFTVGKLVHSGLELELKNGTIHGDGSACSIHFVRHDAAAQRAKTAVFFFTPSE